jgi:hypothetical protein
MELRFLYIGSDDTERDLTQWLALPGARLRWRFRHFGADVAGVDIGTPPLLLIADHRPAGSVLPIYAVGDLDTETARLVDAGWELELGPAGTPEGNATVLRNESDVHIALLEVVRPDALDHAYADSTHEHAVRE